MEVIDAIEKTPTRSRGYHDDVPEKDIIIEKMEVITASSQREAE